VAEVVSVTRDSQREDPEPRNRRIDRRRTSNQQAAAEAAGGWSGDGRRQGVNNKDKKVTAEDSAAAALARTLWNPVAGPKSILPKGRELELELAGAVFAEVITARCRKRVLTFSTLWLAGS